MALHKNTRYFIRHFFVYSIVVKALHISFSTLYEAKYYEDAHFVGMK